MMNRSKKIMPVFQQRKARVDFKAAVQSSFKAVTGFFRDLRTLQRETREFHAKNAQLELFFKKMNQGAQ